MFANTLSRALLAETDGSPLLGAAVGGNGGFGAILGNVAGRNPVFTGLLFSGLDDRPTDCLAVVAGLAGCVIAGLELDTATPGRARNIVAVTWTSPIDVRSESLAVGGTGPTVADASFG